VDIALFLLRVGQCVGDQLLQQGLSIAGQPGCCGGNGQIDICFGDKKGLLQVMDETSGLPTTSESQSPHSITCRIMTRPASEPTAMTRTSGSVGLPSRKSSPTDLPKVCESPELSNRLSINCKAVPMWRLAGLTVAGLYLLAHEGPSCDMFMSTGRFVIFLLISTQLLVPMKVYRIIFGALKEHRLEVLAGANTLSDAPL